MVFKGEPGTVVARENDVGVFGEFEFAQEIEEAACLGVEMFA